MIGLKDPKNRRMKIPLENEVENGMAIGLGVCRGCTVLVGKIGTGLSGVSIAMEGFESC